jgi:uncharacterized iron-regulated membrane protein
LQQLVLGAEQHRPGEVVQYFGFEEDEPNAVLTIMAKTAGSEPNSSHTFMLDARTGEALETPSANGGFMMVMLRLHVDMFAGAARQVAAGVHGHSVCGRDHFRHRAVPAVHAPLKVRHRAPGQIHSPALARPA